MSVNWHGGETSNEGRFLSALGKLVLTVADVEGAAGELIVHNTLSSELPSAWAQSGKQLIRTLRKCYERTDFQVMCHDMEKLLPQRNLLMHGEWMFFRAASETAWVMNRKHVKAIEPTPEYQFAVVRVGDVERLVEAYQRILEGLQGYIGESMGITDEFIEAWNANGPR